MASIGTGKVTTSLSGTQLTYTDTGSYGTVSSRTLTIYDFNGNLLTTINMGSTLTAVYNITADAYFKFVCTVVDNTGTFSTTVDIVAEGIYTAGFLNIMKQIGCSCDSSSVILDNLIIGELFLMTSERFAAGQSPVASQNNIVAANLYINS